MDIMGVSSRGVVSTPFVEVSFVADDLCQVTDRWGFYHTVRTPLKRGGVGHEVFRAWGALNQKRLCETQHGAVREFLPSLPCSTLDGCWSETNQHQPTSSDVRRLQPAQVGIQPFSSTSSDRIVGILAPCTHCAGRPATCANATSADAILASAT